MKAKNILMSILLVVGSIAAKAAGYPPELALVSQPVMVYNYNSVTVYYDVENIGDYTYRGSVYLFLDPDDGYAYAEKYVSVCPGRIKRITLEIPAYRANPGWVYTIMPYYEMGSELYSFSTFEYFEPLEFWWNGPRTNSWIVVRAPARPRYYTRPNPYRFYYDGYRPPMPPPAGYGHGTPPPPMDPMHHTYNYHHSNGGYPANHYTEPKPNDSGTAPSATVRPKPNTGSMSSGSYNGGASTGPASTGSSSGRVNSGTSNSGSTGTNSSGRTGNTGSNSSRVNSSTSNSGSTGTNSSGRTGNSGSNSSRVNSGTSNSGSTGTNSSGRTGNTGSSSGRVSNGSSNSGTSSSGSSSRSSSSNSSSRSSSTRSGSGSGRR
ncbi:MAG: hypothetical protein IJ057_00295 [Bacteroidales bacterium]|nr:hypothetical protein [Bacteroidales bacterium]